MLRRLVGCAALVVVLSACNPTVEQLVEWVAERETAASEAGRPCPQYADEIAWHGLPDHFHDVIWRESRCDPQAVSPAGALGVAQIMPSWLGDLCPLGIACTPADLHDVDRNLAAAAYVLAAQGPGAWSATW